MSKLILFFVVAIMLFGCAPQNDNESKERAKEHFQLEGVPR